MTGDCKDCKHELGYYEKLWICGCECNKDWQPVAVVVERKVKVEEKPKSKSATRNRVESSPEPTDAVGTRTEVPKEEQPEQ